MGDGDEAARFVEVVDQTSFARVVAVACFIGEGVAVPAVDVLAAVVTPGRRWQGRRRISVVIRTGIGNARLIRLLFGC